MKEKTVYAGLIGLLISITLSCILTLIAIWTGDERWFLSALVGGGFFFIIGCFLLAVGKEMS